MSEVEYKIQDILNLVEESETVYDLEERTFRFAKQVRSFVKRLPNSIANSEDSRQLVKASGSVGANYIEANESLSKKDFEYRIKVCQKEAKESRFFLCLVDTAENNALEGECKVLAQEAKELVLIFSAILKKTGSRHKA